LADARAATRAGADALGFTLCLPTGPHEGLTEAGAQEIIERLPPFVCPALITYLNQAGEAAELCQYLGVRTVQLHGEIEMEEVRRLRHDSPHLKIIKSIIVKGREAASEAKAWSREVDALLTDAHDPATGRTGATGKTHDWSISREIVDSVACPVILAGGLTPENVPDAIHAVRPWGVDVHTGIERPDGTFDPGRADAFVAAVLGATT